MIMLRPGGDICVVGEADMVSGVSCSQVCCSAPLALLTITAWMNQKYSHAFGFASFLCSYHHHHDGRSIFVYYTQTSLPYFLLDSICICMIPVTPVTLSDSR